MRQQLKKVLSEAFESGARQTKTDLLPDKARKTLSSLSNDSSINVRFGTSSSVPSFLSASVPLKLARETRFVTKLSPSLRLPLLYSVVNYGLGVKCNQALQIRIRIRNRQRTRGQWTVELCTVATRPCCCSLFQLAELAALSSGLGSTYFWISPICYCYCAALSPSPAPQASAVIHHYLPTDISCCLQLANNNNSSNSNTTTTTMTTLQTTKSCTTLLK